MIIMDPIRTLPGIISNFSGEQFVRDSVNYDKHRYQYGYSSHPERVDPALIAFPSSVDDVCAAVNHARENGLKIALRTGGHQYSAASSTVGNNIQLDLSNAFLDFQPNVPDGTVRVGISLGLNEINKKLRDINCFLPHGQCSHVHVGGHAQTGGYGQLGRSFGLFGDHIQQIDIVTAAGVQKSLNRTGGTNEEREWFFAFLGGSPGNFGVLTHLVLKVHKDSDHPNSRGLKFVCLYSKDILKELLDIKARMVAETNLQGDIDYCVTVLSTNFFSLESNYGIDDVFKRNNPKLFGEDKLPAWPAGIMVYAQWANTNGAAQSTAEFNEGMKWLDEIRDVFKFELSDPLDILIPRFTFFDHSQHTAMSILTNAWIFTNVREFDLPYEKRTYMTDSTTLDSDRWVNWVADRIDLGIKHPKLKLSIQIQHFGGENSKFVTGGAGANPAETAYSWRDSTVCCVMDAFYEPGGQSSAFAWQAENDKCVGRSNSLFCKSDRRVLWGSYNRPTENWDLDANWSFYHEDQAKYDRLRRIKLATDPEGVFVPNKFCIGWNQYAAPPAEKPKALEMVAAGTRKATAASAMPVVDDNAMVKSKTFRMAHDNNDASAGMKSIINQAFVLPYKKKGSTREKKRLFSALERATPKVTK